MALGGAAQAAGNDAVSAAATARPGRLEVDIGGATLRQPSGAAAVLLVVSPQLRGREPGAERAV